MTPHRIQLSRKKGSKMPPNTVSVARPHMFGNPFRIGQLAIYDADCAVRRFKNLVTRQSQRALRADNRFFMFTRESIRFYLRGKNLACYCDLDAPCHADVLLELANK